MSKIEIFSPAKVNLFLAVTGRREDGFHELSSVVSQLSFGDSVRVERMGSEGEIELSCSDPELPTDERNLGFKAAEAYRSEFGIREGIRIHIEKQIPSGAGLGGGSGNASAVLNACSRLFGKGNYEALFRLAAEIGSDCPLFLGTAPCLMRGRGERIEALQAEMASGLRGKTLALFKPSFSISTIWAYKSLASDRSNYSEEEWAEREIADWIGGRKSLNALLFNSFEKMAFGKYPALPLLRDRLDDECSVKMLMSGSGSACFAFCDKEQIDAIRKVVKDCLGDDAFFEETALVD